MITERTPLQLKFETWYSGLKYGIHNFELVLYEGKSIYWNVPVHHAWLAFEAGYNTFRELNFV